ncbi:molecular chaperone [Shewanella gaetbuli]
MIVGFDYGSANCAVGVWLEGEVVQLALGKNSNYLPSTLYAYDRDLIAQAVYFGLPQSLKADYAKLRSSQLARAIQVRHELDLTATEQAVFVGEKAIEAYLDMPEEGFYVRSPKSFLGASGLRAEQVALFEDIVTLMMQHVKVIVDTQLQQKGLSPATHAMIGRPVNFQGIGGEQSNQQAEAILSVAAKRAGFDEVKFLFEPIAAGMDFEASLTENANVLVVDVGGGTTDCSLVKMGPSLQTKQDRSQDFYGHTGQRVGGNDLDIALAMHGFMPSFGSQSAMLDGKPMPSNIFWNAVAVNDISAQRDFYQLSTKKLIDALIKDAKQPELIKRLQVLHANQMSFQVVRQAELTKMALSDAPSHKAAIDFIEAGLTIEVTEPQFEQAIQSSLDKVSQLMQQAMTSPQAQSEQVTTPDIVYITGGTARSPAIYNQIAKVYPQASVVVGDHFGSVTAGLTRTAQQAFKG